MRKCKRCGYEWKERKELPRLCARCKSPYWDREYLKKNKHNWSVNTNEQI